MLELILDAGFDINTPFLCISKKDRYSTLINESIKYNSKSTFDFLLKRKPNLKKITNLSPMDMAISVWKGGRSNSYYALTLIDITDIEYESLTNPDIYHIKEKRELPQTFTKISTQSFDANSDILDFHFDPSIDLLF